MIDRWLRAKIDLDGKLLAVEAKFKALAENTEGLTQRQMFSEIAATMAKWAALEPQTVFHQKMKRIALKFGRNLLKVAPTCSPDFVPALWGNMRIRLKLE